MGNSIFEASITEFLVEIDDGGININMIEKPLISVVIAVYNNERYLKKAVESVEKQNFDDYEIIIVDDGSTDNTPSIVDELAYYNEKIKVIHQDNQWIYASFNNGIKAAKGEYIYILNSDDKLADGSLEMLKNELVKYNYPDVIYTKVQYCWCDSEQQITKKEDLNPRVIVDEYINFNKNNEKWIELLSSNLLTNQANLYKRELIICHPFRNDVYGADYLFNIELAYYIRTAAVVTKDVYLFYNYNDVNMNASENKYYDYTHSMFNEFYEKAEELLKKKGLYDEVSLEIIQSFRRRNLRREIRSYLNYENHTEFNEKVKVIENEYWDEIVAKSFSIKGKLGFDELVKDEISKYKK